MRTVPVVIELRLRNIGVAVDYIDDLDHDVGP